MASLSFYLYDNDDDFEPLYIDDDIPSGHAFLETFDLNAIVSSITIDLPPPYSIYPSSDRFDDNEIPL